MLKNKIIATLFGLSVLMLFVSALVGGIGLPDSHGPLVIRFDKFIDEANLVGDFRTVFGLGLTASFVIVLNFLLAWEIYARERFLSYILAAGAFIVSLLFLIAVSGIVAVN